MQHGSANITLGTSTCPSFSVHCWASLHLNFCCCNREPGGDTHSKLDIAMASATQLSTSHCVEMTWSIGANGDSVASTIKSGIDIQTPGNLMVLIVAVATGMCFIFLIENKTLLIV